MSDEIMTAAEVAENAALPRARVAMAGGGGGKTAEQEPLPEAVARRPEAQKSPAEWAYERIILYIQKFEEGLDADHEVGLGVAGSDAGALHIQGVGFFAPDLVTFYGADEGGSKTQLIQHVTQLNVMLKAVAKQQEKAARIGFDLARQLEEA